nr:cell wall-binding repeat-containing protein [Bifidobacterium sp. DSM 109963]
MLFGGVVPSTALASPSADTSSENTSSQAPSAAQSTEATTFPVHTIKKNVDDDNAFVMLFMGDGYTKDEQAQFLQHVKERTQALLRLEPYRQYSNYINVYAMCVESKESGVSVTDGLAKDTYLGVSHRANSRAATIRTDLDFQQRIFDLRDEVSAKVLTSSSSFVPEVSSVHIISNSTHYHGRAFINDGYSISSLNDDGTTTGAMAAHEISHQIGWIWDEYDSNTGYANVDAATNGTAELVKWRKMLGFGGVGIAKGSSASVVIPGSYCFMKALGNYGYGTEVGGWGLCEVCRLEVARYLLCANNLSKTIPMHIAYPEITKEHDPVTTQPYAMGLYRISDRSGSSNMRNCKDSEIEFRTVVQNVDKEKKRNITLRLETSNADGNVKQRAEETFAVSNYGDSEKYLGMDSRQSLRSLSVKMKCDGSYEGTETILGEVIDADTGEVLATDKNLWASNEQTTLNIKYVDSDTKRELEDVGGAAVYLGSGETYQVTHPSSVAGYQYVGNDSANDRIVMDSTAKTLTYYFSETASPEPGPGPEPEPEPEPEPVAVEPPTAKSGLVYNGKSQTGVDGATGYTLSGQSATNAGSYTATATLAEGYVWSDGSSDVKKIAWSIAKAKPSYTVPSNLSGVQDSKLSDVKLPDGWAWKNPSTVLSKTGKQQYDAVYTPGDTGNYTTVEQKLTVNVTAAPVKVKIPTAKSGLVYNGKSQTGVNGATGYTLSGQTTATNAGSYTATATLAKGYVWSDGSSAAKKIGWSIAKAKPSYTTPSNLSGVQGSKLSSVKLPSGWAWKNSSTTLSKTGKQQYDAVYTPGDTCNYTTVAQKLTVNVTAKPTPAPVKVKSPTAKSGLVYNGKSQTGVNGATGYTLSGQTATNAGSYTATATLAKGYVWSDGSSGAKKITWSIGKAKPSYTTPSNLSGVQGSKLSSVKLPSGWAWKNSSTTLSKTGKQQYDAVYTPGDTRNYTTVAQKLTVNVTAKSSSSRSQLQRLAGDTRYDTMARLVATAFPKTSGTVVVANGGNYPDALSASGLAGVLGAPIVLTDSGALSNQAASQLKRLRPSRIVIAGGTSAVSSRVESQLRGYAKNVERQAGSTRYDTSYKLYARGGKSWGTTAIVATGANYADALSISSYAYAMKAPVFLCDPNGGLTSQQKSALNKFKRVVVVGGENAVPSRLVKGLPGLTRLSGNTRYDTSVAIAKWVQKNGLGMNGVVYATGEHFADALAAGPLAGRNKSAMLLVADPNSPTVSYSASYRGKLTKAYVAGGTSAVSTATANAIADKLNMKQP